MFFGDTPQLLHNGKVATIWKTKLMLGGRFSIVYQFRSIRFVNKGEAE